MKNTIKFVVLDIDGVCTDGKLYYDMNGNVTKCFYAQDGLAIITALKNHMGIGVITGRSDAAVAQRMSDLGIIDYHAGYTDKLKIVEKIKNKYKLDWSEISFIGDDWIDLSSMMQVGYPISVANGCDEVKAIAKYITKARGGEGAVREALLHIFEQQGITSSELAKIWLVH